MYRFCFVILFLPLPCSAVAKNIAVYLSGSLITSGTPTAVSPSPIAGTVAQTLIYTIANSDDTGGAMTISSLGAIWAINMGFDSIKVDGVEIDYSNLANNSYSIDPSASIELSVTYTPTDVGQFGSMIEIESDADNNDLFSLQFAGNATANPEIDVSFSGASVGDGGSAVIATAATPGELEMTSLLIRNRKRPV